jgi:O-antigen/teichoic acid export membrane protein
MLFRKHENSFFFPARQSVYATWVIYKPMLMQVIKYGFPLTIWMFFSFLLTYADRVYISRGAFTLDIASDYIALADAISRGCGFLFIPLNISVYPVISKIFDEGDKAGTRILIVKVLKMQALLVLATAIGLVVASPIIANLLRLSSPGWLHNAMLILALLSIYALWQSCAMIQKPMELSMKTGWLAILVLLSVLLVYLLVFVVVKPQNPFALIACLATGIITYATINVWLLVKFLKANPG